MPIGLDPSAAGARPARIARDPLAGRLREAIDAGHLLLVAPAGYGKTTALEEAIAAPGAPALARIRCRGHGSAGQLLLALADALRGACPGLVDVVGERIAAGLEPLDPRSALHEVAAELERLLVDPLLVVFDDAERLAARPDALELIQRLLDSDAAPLRVAVCTRQPLPLRTARLEVAGRLTQAGVAELAFSPDECAAVLRLARGRDPGAGEVEEVLQRTEGWPLGVSLAAVGSAGARRGALSAFLDEEVLDRLEPAFSSALLVTSLPEQIDEGLATALGAPAGFLDELRVRGLFVQERDGGATLAYHPLVRDFLLERLHRERSDADLCELHLQTGRALASGGRTVEAIDHLLAAGEWQEATTAIAGHGPLLARTEPETVGRWLGRLPEEVGRQAEPALLAGRLAAGSGRLREAREPLAAAVDAFAARGDVQGEWLARVALADALFLLQDFEPVVELASGFGESPAFGAPMVAVAAAAALARCCRFDESAEMYRRATEHPAGVGWQALEPGFSGFYIDLPAGRLDRALAGVRDGVERLQQGDDPFERLPYMLGFLALIHEARGEDEAALGAARQATALTERRLVGGYIGDVARLFTAGMHARAGRVAEAELELEQVRIVPEGWFASDPHVTRATVAVQRGEHVVACDAAEAALAEELVSSWFERERTTALAVPVLVAAGRPERAREALETALAACPPACSSSRLLGLRAWVRRLGGHEPAALDDLVQAWEESGAECVHLVRRDWERIESLLRQGAEQGALDAAELVTAVAAARPGGDALLPLADSPQPAVRRAVAAPLAASGHPASAGALHGLAHDAHAGVATVARGCAERLSVMPPPLVISLLGGFDVRRGTWRVPPDAWGRRIAERLVRHLLLHRASGVHEELLFEAFWPGKPPSAARRSLQVAVSCARSVLDPAASETSAVEVGDRVYRLVLREGDSVDADEFAVAARAALEHRGDGRRDLLLAAQGLWGGEPLPEDRYEDWAVAWRESMLDLYGELLSALVDAHEQAGDTSSALDAARGLVGVEPLSEGAHRRLMAAYARAGRRGHALRQFLACRRALVDELGVEPGEETTRLHRAVLAGDPV
ncbi:MAG: BTAD domain-containing putative transcriptional regulator [Thermoleophilaceae bacterium]